MALNSYREFDEMVVEVDAWWEKTLQEFEDMMQGDRKQYMQPQQPQEQQPQELPPEQEVSNDIASAGVPSGPSI